MHDHEDQHLIPANSQDLIGLKSPKRRKTENFAEVSLDPYQVR